MTNEELAKGRYAVSERIKELRIQMGYTSYETFAIEKGFSRRGYWSLENGGNFTLNTLLKIADIHNISLSEFFKKFT